MNQIHIQYYKTEIGELILGSFDEKLCLLDFRARKKRTSFDARIKNALKAGFVEQNDAVLAETKKQLEEYFNGNRTTFDIPLLLVGTDFQKRVWAALQQVPYGMTSSYAQLASDINNPKAVRAVANANGANPIGVIVPCHRIIGKDGSLTGYTGGLPIKKYLLELEHGANTSE
ncbi:MAG: methylated-DNA--[protein]-cysteine S-methyltransferase [Desulfuromonas sp.]